MDLYIYLNHCYLSNVKYIIPVCWNSCFPPLLPAAFLITVLLDSLFRMTSLHRQLDIAPPKPTLYLPQNNPSCPIIFFWVGDLKKKKKIWLQFDKRSKSFPGLSKTQRELKEGIWSCYFVFCILSLLLLRRHWIDLHSEQVNSS